MQGRVVGVVVGSLKQTTAIAVSGTIAQNVNYAIKSQYLIPLLDGIPEIRETLGASDAPSPRSAEEAIATLEKATAIVLVY